MVTKEKVSKFGDKAVEGIFLGYSVNSPNKRVYIKSTHQVEEHFEVKCLRHTDPPQGTGPDWFFNYKDVFNSFNIPEEDQEEELVTLLHGIGLSQETSNPIIKPSDPIPDSTSNKTPTQTSSPSPNPTPNPPPTPTPESTSTPSPTPTTEVPSSSPSIYTKELPYDPNMPPLEDIQEEEEEDEDVNYSHFYSLDDEDDEDEEPETTTVPESQAVSATEGDLNNLDMVLVPDTIPVTRVHKDHPIENIIGDPNAPLQTRSQAKKTESQQLLTLLLRQILVICLRLNRRR